jgi:hypothetical protein
MAALEEFARLSGKLYVDGALVASAATGSLDVIDPATEERLGQIADATDAEIDQAIAAAGDPVAARVERDRRAQPGGGPARHRRAAPAEHQALRRVPHPRGRQAVQGIGR